MKYRYIAIFSIKGLTQPPDARDTELVIDSGMNLRAILTSQPNIYSFERDRGLVVAGLMMRGLFEREPIGEDFQQHILPAKAIRDVARKYLRLHVSSAASEKAPGTVA